MHAVLENVMLMAGYTLLYQDAHLLVVSKPPGLLTVPGRLPENKDCLITRIQQDFPTAAIVHRLDMATSGLLVVPITKPTLSNLARQFQQRQIEKRYQAVVAGLIEQDQGTIKAPLMCDWPNRPRQMVHPEGKPSVTHFRVLHRDHRLQHTYVDLFPVTGRSHQLRVHLLHIGHPILGDNLYAPEPTIAESHRLLLHAQYLSFKHPDNGAQFCFTQPADDWPN